ncbi:MAG: tRNA (N(6)-L-threonylcarbamoyladenosine(37)-C(2))-methylthiotransferase MtaB [Lentimicrobium sp.]
MNSVKVAFHTLGCKLNFAETSTLIRRFREHGYQIIDFDKEADIYVIHTCSVTSVAEKKSRAAIYQAHRRNPKASIAVIGCYPELEAERLKEISGVKWVLGNQEKFQIAELISHDFSAKHEVSVASAETAENLQEFYPAYSSGDRTRSFLKIQDGCDHFCSYCSIPYSRGRSRSSSIQDTLQWARKAAAEGVKEIVLTGVNIGDFGRKNGESLFDLLRCFDKERIVERVRLSSIEPELLSKEIIRLVADSQVLMPHFHIPLQSGSNTILKRMKRKYTTEVFESRVRYIKQLMPYACIACDVIVGFPGETDELFEETYQFIEDLPISYLHVFSYSQRANTLALKFTDEVPPLIKHSRSQILHQCSAIKLDQFYNFCRHHYVNVLFESENTEGMMSGYSENYIRVETPFREDFVNRIIHLPLEQRNIAGDYVYYPQ